MVMARDHRLVLVAFLALVLPLGSCGGPASAHLSGRALLRGQADSSGIAITVSCARQDDGQNFNMGQTTVTKADGTFDFEMHAAPSLRCLVAASDPTTSEKSLSTLVDLGEGGSATAPDLVFTPTGGLHGRILLVGSAQGEAGTTVVLQGTDMMAATDDAGEYSIMDVPTGTYRLEARHDGFASATAEGQVIAYAQTLEAPTLSLTPTQR